MQFRSKKKERERCTATWDGETEQAKRKWLFLNKSILKVRVYILFLRWALLRIHHSMLLLLLLLPCVLSVAHRVLPSDLHWCNNHAPQSAVFIKQILIYIYIHIYTQILAILKLVRPLNHFFFFYLMVWRFDSTVAMMPYKPTKYTNNNYIIIRVLFINVLKMTNDDYDDDDDDEREWFHSGRNQTILIPRARWFFHCDCNGIEEIILHGTFNVYGMWNYIFRFGEQKSKPWSSRIEAKWKVLFLSASKPLKRLCFEIRFDRQQIESWQSLEDFIPDHFWQKHHKICTFSDLA